MRVHINRFLPIIDLNHNLDQTVFISSFGRSGSTFLAQLLNYKRDYRILFEPLKEHEQYGFDFEQWIPTSERSTTRQDIIHYFSNMMAGKLSSNWIDRDNKAGIYTKRIVKEVRSNLLIPWLTETFPFVRFIVLLRNPFDVYNSWTKSGWENGFELRDILSKIRWGQTFDTTFYQDFLNEQNEFLCFIYAWIIYNYPPLKLTANDNLLVVKYEDLLDKNSELIDQLKSYCQIDIAQVPGSLFYKPSSSSDRSKDFRDRISEKLEIDANTLERAKHILRESQFQYW